MAKTRPPLPNPFDLAAYGAARPELVEALSTVGDETPVTIENIRRGSDVKPHAVPYLWFPYIPQGELVAVSGDSDSGKTFLSLFIAAAVQQGKTKQLPGDPLRAGRKGKTPVSSLSTPADVLILQRENSEATTILPRFTALGGDATGLVLPSEPFAFGANPTTAEGLVNIDGYLRLAWYIEATGARFAFVDPITGFLGAADLKSAPSVRTALERLQNVARFTGATIAYIAHQNKDYGNPTMKGRVQYSGEFVNVPRSLLVAQLDPDAVPGPDLSHHVIHHEKNNLGKSGGPVGFTIEGDLELDGRVDFLWRSVDPDRTAADVNDALNGTGADEWENRAKPGKVRDEATKILAMLDHPIWVTKLKDAIAEALEWEGVDKNSWERGKQYFPFAPYETESISDTDPRPRWETVKGSGLWAWKPIGEVPGENGTPTPIEVDGDPF